MEGCGNTMEGLAKPRNGRVRAGTLRHGEEALRGLRYGQRLR